nr:DUF255 domain-containing protein [Saprospiraceae bacterium]
MAATKYIFSILFILCTLTFLSAQETVQWMSFEEAIEAHKHEPKKIFVDMYTDWCGWCKKMDAETFQQEDIASYLNEHYYAVKFNAESKEDIEFQNVVYSYVKQGSRGYHEFAIKLAERLERLSFPTVVFIDENLNVIQPLAGFMKPEQFKPIVSFIAENHYLRTPWKKYEQEFKGLTSSGN